MPILCTARLSSASASAMRPRVSTDSCVCKALLGMTALNLGPGPDQRRGARYSPFLVDSNFVPADSLVKWDSDGWARGGTSWKG